MLVIDEIQEYMNFGEDDRIRILELRDRVHPEFGNIVEAFYTALNANPRTRSVFSGPEQVEKLCGTLFVWLEDIFSGEYDHAYFKRHNRIGQRHVEVGLLPHFMFGAMNVIRLGILEVIMREQDLPEDRILYIQSIDRLLDLELTVMVQSYWDSLMQMKLKVPAALASGLAHEIRNPLNAVALNITLLERKIRNGGEGTEPILEAMRTEVRRITNMTSEIMDFAKPVEIAPTWYDAQNLLDSMTINLGQTMKASKIEFHTSFEGDDSAIWCDSDRIKQAVMNLLSNAIEAVGGEHGKIKLKVVNSHNGTEISVADSGEGMTTTIQYRVYDLFFTSKASGTGLGLPIVKKIVDAHEGTISIISKPGDGATFTIYLPRPNRP